MKGLQIFAIVLTCGPLPGCGSDPAESPRSTNTPLSDSYASEAGKNMADSEYEIVDVYTGLRDQVLHLKSDKIGPKGATKTDVNAVLMEMGYDRAIVMLVAISDGTSSLYFSNGGGIIGAGQHQGVRDVGKSFINSAQDFIGQSLLTEKFPHPTRGFVRFYFVTDGGVYTASGLEEELGNRRHEYSPLFHKGHELIAVIREVSAK